MRSQQQALRQTRTQTTSQTSTSCVRDEGLAPQSAVQKHQLHSERGKVMSEGAPCRQPRPGTYLVCRPTEEHHTQRVGLLLPAHSRRRFSHWIHHLPLHVAPAHATVFAPSDPVSTKTPLPIVHGQQRGGVRGARVETTEVRRQQCKGHCTAMPIPHRHSTADQPFEATGRTAHCRFEGSEQTTDNRASQCADLGAARGSRGSQPVL